MYQIFESLLQNRGITTYRISKDTHIAQSVFSAWKNGVSTPKPDKLKKIADYFGVSIDYLMTGKDSVGFSNSCCLDEKVVIVAKEISENEDLRTVFDVARGRDAERLISYAKFLQAEEKKNEI